MALIHIPSTHIKFMQHRWFNFAFSLIMVGVTLLFFMLKGLNYGVDFKGGIIIEVRTPEVMNVSHMRQKLGAALGGDVALQHFGSPKDLLIRLENQGDDAAARAAIAKVKIILGDQIDYRRIETVGPKVGQELVKNGLIAIFWALLAMMAYIWFRFEWRFGVAALLSLAHDCVGLFGLFSVFRLEFNETAIVAILITASYSINDTVVIFDRIRENRTKYKKMPFGEMLNLSINETLSRTILTSSTTLLSLLILYFFGGPVIASFSLPIFVGIALGTYSSICVAAPLLSLFQPQGPHPKALANQNSR